MLNKYSSFIGVVLLLCGTSACAQPEQTRIAVEDEAVDPYVVQSYPMDSKEYRYVELDNGLRALLVSDADVLQAAAALRVDVGSFQDPEGWDGLAHFLEHMLFLGTEKYPDADEYANYLQAHGGQRNATTAYHATNYHFSVSADYLEGALDRFAQFFVAPLFSEEYVEREKNAVHSEYFTRIDNDGIRFWEVFENVINPAHPAVKFNAGNLDTLSDKPGQTAREVLIEFYETYYSADGMTLAMVSNHSLDELERLVREKFSEIPVREAVPDTVFPPLFEAGELPKIVEVKPVTEQRSLTLMFPIGRFDEYFRENPLGFVTSLLASDADNSLQERLKDRGWILGVSATIGQHYGGNGTLMIGVGLTETGMQHQDEIIAALFDQIALVREQGVVEWRYDEIRRMAEMGFRYSADGSIGMGGVIALSGALYYALPRDLIGAGFKRFDADVINAVLDDLRPDNMVVTLVSPEVEPDRTTEYYGAEYRTYRPSAERVERWNETLYTDLTLHEKNPLMPERFELEDIVTAEKPVLLNDSGAVELWYFPDNEDGVPRANIQFMIDRPDRPTVEQVLIEQFYSQLMSEQLKVLNYTAGRAGMSYGIGSSAVVFSGYSDKLPELSELVLEEFLQPKFTQEDFDRLVDSTERNFRNISTMSPTQGVGLELMQLLNADSRPIEEQLAAVRKVTLEDVLAAPEWLYGEARLQMLAAGNITEAQAREFADRIVDRLGITGTDREIPRGMRVVRLSPSEPPHDVLLVSKLEHQDAAVLRYYQGRDDSREERIKLRFLGQLIGQHYFNELRTEQQLGYIVQAGANQVDQVPGLTFTVQSPTADAGRIEAANDGFLPSFGTILAEMTEAEFAPHKQAWLDNLAKPPQNRNEKISSFWSQLRQGYPEFDLIEQSIAAIEAVTLEDVRNAYREVVLEEPRVVSVITPGALGGVEGTIENAQAYRQGKDVIVRD